MCALAATLDQRCFEIGTEPTGKKLQSLFELLDTDQNGQLNYKEFLAFWRMMDLDNSFTINPVEISAWFTRNQYLICRPHRKIVLERLNIAEHKYLHPLFRFLDADSSLQIDAKDVIPALIRLDRNNDKKIDR
jgi:Ca2+-binding EF-hand superfamily protein